MENRLTADQLDSNGCFNMLYAMVQLLARDFRVAYRAAANNPRNTRMRRRYRRIRDVFTSEYFSVLTGLDGSAVVDQLESEPI